MSLNVYTDAEFGDNNAPPVPKDDEVAQMSAATAEWLSQVQTLSQTAPKEGLTRLLRVPTVMGGDRTVSVMNSARMLIGRAFPPAHSRAAYSACEALYHLCLHRTLLKGLEEVVATKGLATPMQLDPLDRDSASLVVLDEGESLAGLVQACAEVVNVALAADDRDDLFPATSLRMGRTKQWTELVQGLAWIHRATLPAPLAGAFPGEPDAVALPPFPAELQQYFSLIMEDCISIHCFQHPSSYFERIASVKPTDADISLAAWTTPNGRIVRYITGLAEELAENRTSALCYGLCKYSGAAAAEAVAEPLRTAAVAMVTAVMRAHFDLVFNRNLTLVCIAAVMTAAKWGGLRVKMSSVQAAAEELYDLDEETLTFMLEMPTSAVDELKALKKKKKKEKKKVAEGIGNDPDSDGSDDDETVDEEKEVKEGPPKEFYNALFVPMMELYRGDGDDDMAALFQGSGPALKAAVAAAMAKFNGGDVIVLEYPPGTAGTGTGSKTKRSSRTKIEGTPEPGLRKNGGGGGGAGGVAGSGGASNWTGGDAGPLTTPRGGAVEPGTASARRPSAAKPAGKPRGLVAVSGGRALASKKKR